MKNTTIKAKYDKCPKCGGAIQATHNEKYGLLYFCIPCPWKEWHYSRDDYLNDLRKAKGRTTPKAGGGEGGGK